MTNLTIQDHVGEATGTPTPEWLDTVMSWALSGVSQLVQKMGGIVGVVVGIAVVLLVWWQREALRSWWRHRSKRFKWSLAAVFGVALLATASMGAYVWDYVQHDNNFCASCHVMLEPFEKFKKSEHSQLKCHDCHRQSAFASLNQLYLWVDNRPEDIGPHAPVPTAVCADCHITQDPDSTWQRISATAGHRVHLEADTTALKDVQCVTCHGVEVHRFAPVDQTCGQSGCHEPDKTEVVLGEMAGQTGFHCVMCHEFTAPVTEEVPLDTARAALVPELEDCRSCHEMETVLAGLVDPDVDPHDAVCGTCHNPHTQEAPSEAIERCAECHAPADTLTPFHRGLRAGVLEDCTGCHAPHTFVVEGKNCAACHADIIGGTSTAGFNHRNHRDVECTECHTTRETHGQVTIESRAACQQCHHTRPVVDRGCAGCHGKGELSAAIPVSIRMDPSRQAPDRQLRFGHDDHPDLSCAECHAQGVSMKVGRTCASCHESHHTATASCVTCHNQPNRASHTAQVHTRSCAGSSCHESASYGAMTQGRNTCVACHQDQTDHRPGQACAGCHRVSFSSLDLSSGKAVAR